MLAQEKLAWWAAGSYTTAENKDLAGFFSRMAEIRRTFEQAAKVDKKAAELLQTLARIEQAFRARQEDAAGDPTFDGRNAAPVDIGTMQLWYRQFEDYLLKQWDKSNPLRAKLIKLIKEAEANLGKVYVSRQARGIKNINGRLANGSFQIFRPLAPKERALIEQAISRWLYSETGQSSRGGSILPWSRGVDG